MPAPAPARFRSAALSLLWFMLAFAVSEWGVVVWLGPDRDLLPRARLPLAAATVILAALGILTWIAAERAAVRRLNVAALSFLLVGPIAAEAALRFSFTFDGSPTRSPIRYAHNLIDDDYWILAGRWETYGPIIAPKRVHPTLGWSQAWVSGENPLGLLPRTREQLVVDGRPKVLFYGDSYVAGIAARENRIPVYMDDRLPGTDVVHLGVGGYGTGQAHLLLRETQHLVERPLVLMGVMVFDFDRAALSVRSYQKPRLRSGPGGALDVTNVPVDPDPERFFRSARLTFHSYVLAALRRRYLVTEDPSFGDRVELNRAIIAANHGIAQEHGARLMYILFHTKKELLDVDARSTFFLEELAARGIPCFDTREVLLGHIEETGIDPGDLYVRGHHNDLGNQLIGDALVQSLRDLGVR